MEGKSESEGSINNWETSKALVPAVVSLSLCLPIWHKHAWASYAHAHTHAHTHVHLQTGVGGWRASMGKSVTSQFWKLFELLTVASWSRCYPPSFFHIYVCIKLYYPSLFSHASLHTMLSICYVVLFPQSHSLWSMEMYTVCFCATKATYVATFKANVNMCLHL